MATKNATFETTTWQDVETMTGTSIVAGDTYNITIRGGYRGEVCTAEAQPDESLFGHPLTANENFSCTPKTGENIYVRAGVVGATLVFT